MEHYFTENPKSREIISEIKVLAFGKSYDFFTASGLFSWKELDKGSKLLLESVHIPDCEHVLDLGCGFGVIGIILALQHPHATFLLSDINARAVKVSDMNIKRHHLRNARAIQSDGFKNIAQSFDQILLNPPQTAGREVCLRLIREAKDHLNQGGKLTIVARHQKGGKTLAAYMKEMYGNCEEGRKSSGFRIYISVKKKS